MPTMRQCPDCTGRGRIHAHINRGDQPHSWEDQDCGTCGASGMVTPEHVDRIAEGERRREDRKARALSLREEARRLGISAQELSDIEHGRTSRISTP